MFSGIIESIGIITNVLHSESNIHVWISAPFHSEISIDQSIAHNGICLTVDQIENNEYRITAIQETIEKTTISEWKIGDKVNLERCLKLGDRLDGHIVQGHIDTTASCISCIDKQGSWEYQFQIPERFSSLIIEKGSIAINGISLTCHSLSRTLFTVSIIPYTYEHTNAKFWEVGNHVNIEFDIIGKYLQRSLERKD